MCKHWHKDGEAHEALPASPITCELRFLREAEIIAHDQAVDGVRRDRQQGARRDEAEALFHAVKDIFDGGEAERRGHAVHDGIEAIVKRRMPPRRYFRGFHLAVLFHQRNADEVFEGEVAQRVRVHEDQQHFLEQHFQDDRRNHRQRAPEKHLSQQALWLLLDPILAIDPDDENDGRQQRQFDQKHNSLLLYSSSTAFVKISPAAWASCPMSWIRT